MGKTETRKVIIFIVLERNLVCFIKKLKNNGSRNSERYNHKVSRITFRLIIYIKNANW